MVPSESDGKVGDPVAMILPLLIPMLVPRTTTFVIVFMLLVELCRLVLVLVPYMMKLVVGFIWLL